MSVLPTDDDLAREYTRVRVNGGAPVVEVAVVTWPHTHRPDVAWIEVARLPADAPGVEVDRARRRLLAQRKYFVICKECRERNAKGHTEGGVCHSCLERNHGVAF